MALAPQAGDGGANPQLALRAGDGGAGVLSQPPRAQARGYFSALGNRFLLGRPLAQVQVSRRFFGYKRIAKPGGGLKIAKDAAGEPIVEFSTPDFEKRREELFAAAKRGAVLLSPCVSDGERQIAREALAAGLPLITMANKGFSPLQKPSGRYFDACADGKLLMLAPAAWPYQPGEKPMTRFDATAMNRLCQWIAGEGAAEINYHGMKPENVDALALKAVTKIEVLTGNLVHAAKDTDPKANTSITNQAGANLHLMADILLNGVCDVNGVPLLDNSKED